MRSHWLAWFGLLAAILCCSRADAQQPGHQEPAKPFVVFDGTQYLHKPDLRAVGVEPIYIAYEQSLFREEKRDRRAADAMPTADRIDAQILAARKAGSRFLVIDIEWWSVYGSRENPREVARNIAHYERTVALARSRAQGMLIGLFSPLPVYSGYERLIAPADSEAHSDMVADNDKMVRLASMVDAIFPIGYTVTADRDEWKRAVTKHVSEARRLREDAPVYVFVWPQYADYRPTPREIQHRWVPAEYWRFQLDTIYEIADGVVIWGGWDLEAGQRRKWDEQAPWWQATRKFMRDKGVRRPRAPVLHH